MLIIFEPIPASTVCGLPLVSTHRFVSSAILSSASPRHSALAYISSTCGDDLDWPLSQQ